MNKQNGKTSTGVVSSNSAISQQKQNNRNEICKEGEGENEQFRATSFTTITSI
jgi:hypothetical protein